jgi:putative transposase
MTAWVQSPGDAVHHTRVARRRRTMGVATISPTPRLRAPHPAQRISPDLLRGVPITRGPQVWRTAIAAMRLQGGLLSLVAVMEGCSRSVRSWAVSITREVGFWLEALEQALGVAHPESVNRAQGAQCPSLDVTGRLASAGIRMRMDGRGQALDHVVVARLGRTVQEEEVDVQDAATPREAMQGFAQCFVRSNAWRQHQALGDQTPAAVYGSSSVEQSIFMLTHFCLDDGDASVRNLQYFFSWSLGLMYLHKLCLGTRLRPGKSYTVNVPSAPVNRLFTELSRLEQRFIHLGMRWPLGSSLLAVIEQPRRSS